VLTLFPLVETAPSAVGDAEEEVPGGLFQRAREKGSDINRAIVNGTAVKKHIEPKTEKNYARALGLWNG